MLMDDRKGKMIYAMITAETGWNRDDKHTGVDLWEHFLIGNLCFILIR